jgi:hypothetical protein
MKIVDQEILRYVQRDEFTLRNIRKIWKRFRTLERVRKIQNILKIKIQTTGDRGFGFSTRLFLPIAMTLYYERP